MDPLVVAGGFVAGLSTGSAVALYLARTRWLRAQRRAATVRETADQDFEALRTESNTRTAEEKARLARALDDEIRTEHHNLDDYEADLRARDELLAAREDTAGERRQELDQKRAATDRARDAAAQRRQELDETRGALLSKLEGRAGVERKTVVGQLVNERVAKIELGLQRRRREDEERLNQDAAVDGRRVMAVAADRYHGIGHLERIQNAIRIPDPDTLAALSDPEADAHIAFKSAVECEVVLDEAKQTLTVRGDDPLAREVARRVLRQLANRSIRAPDRIRRIARTSKNEIEREVQNAGGWAVRKLGIGKLHPDILHLVGRLKYRLSYSQNQWKHSVEVGYLSGIMAAELGLDVRLARRGGLLHDIGKAMTHDHEGSHAVLGAQVARRCGENEIVANAIGSHHNDEPKNHPIALIVTAADAMSGARPGARRESVTSYLDRISTIQRIAGRSRLVQRVDIMHAGREVRVVVTSDERGDVDGDQKFDELTVSDADLYPLAQQIAREIEEEVIFAGQIRVTVIRESHSITMAH